MRTWRTILCLIVIAACLPGILLAAGRLPIDNEPLVAKKYAGWSGVLRIWAFEGWTGGDCLAGWINRCAAGFEKAHNGVYVQVKYVEAEALARLGQTGVRPPDMILFPPGLLDGAEGLLPVDASAVRSALAASGGGYAVPVALGGYGWAVNAAAEGAAIPEDEEWRCWSRAAQALGFPGEPAEEETDPAPPGMDLGLPATASMEEIDVRADALAQFINGDLGAAAVTQRELLRLTRLSEQGRGPEWTFQPGRGAYTDQALYLAVVAGEEATAALSMEFLDRLLSDECQSALVQFGAFPTTGAPSGASGCLAQMDQWLRRTTLEAAPAFGVSSNVRRNAPARMFAFSKIEKPM